MLHIIPALEIMKTVTDKNINSSHAKVRRQAFEKANELQSITKGTMIIEGVMFDRITPRLNAQHKQAIEFLYKIDYSGKDVSDYNITSTINFIAKREAKVDYVIILTENTSKHNPDGHKRIVSITPIDFLGKMLKFKELYDSYMDYIKLNPQAKEFRGQIIDGMVTAIFFSS
jgi:hypothetical protein